MGSLSDSVDAIFRAHAEIREKLCRMKESLARIEEPGTWDCMTDILSFFNENIVQHCALEDDLMSLVRSSDRKCGPDELQIICEFQQEHRVMIADLERLCAVAHACEAGRERALRDAYCHLALDIIEKTRIHTDMEDAVLCPLAGAITDGQSQEPGDGPVSSAPMERLPENE